MIERRYDPVLDEWRTFATHRQDRTYFPGDEHCPLCPTRPGGAPTEVPRPSYDIVVFDNRFPSLVARPPDPASEGTALTPVQPAVGAAEVVLWSDDHHLTLAELPVDRLHRLIDVWSERYAELGSRPSVEYVFIFENKGAPVGVTLEHPHGQIYAFPDIPPRVRRHLEAARRHLNAHQTCVVCEVGAQERAGQRCVAQNQSFIAYVPFAPRFPYEVHVQAHRHAASLLDLTDPERRQLADVLHRVLAGYDALFGFSLPYVLAVQQSPTDDGEWQAVSHLRVEITPLHRRPDRLKYLAGSELGAGAFIGDALPEVTAGHLRDAVARSEGSAVTLAAGARRT